MKVECCNQEKDAAKGQEPKQEMEIEKLNDWTVKVIDSNFNPTDTTRIVELIEKMVVPKFEEVKPQDQDGEGDEEIEYEDIGNELYKQNIEREITANLRKALNDVIGQKYNVIIGDLFGVIFNRDFHQANISVGKLQMTVFEAERTASKAS